MLGVVISFAESELISVDDEWTRSDAPPTDAPPTEAPPTEAPPTEAPPTSEQGGGGGGGGAPFTFPEPPLQEEDKNAEEAPAQPLHTNEDDRTADLFPKLEAAATNVLVLEKGDEVSPLPSSVSKRSAFRKSIFLR